MTSIEIQKILLDLNSRKAADKRNAAKKIGKNLIYELVDELFNAYNLESKDDKNWETLIAMIKALGRLGCEKILPDLEVIVKNNKEEDLLTTTASTAYVRLKGKKESYFKITKDLFSFALTSVAGGALRAIYFDNIKLEESEVLELFEIVKIFKHLNNPYTVDIRQTLICILSKYPKDFIKPLVEQFRNLETVDDIVIEYALKGKSYYANEY